MGEYSMAGSVGRKLGICLFLFISLAISGCGGGGGDGSTASSSVAPVTLIFTVPRLVEPAPAALASRAALPPAGITLVVVTISGTGMATIVKNIPVKAGVTITQTFNVPVGSKRNFSIQGFNAAGKGLYQGSQQVGTLQSGVPVVLNVLMLPTFNLAPVPIAPAIVTMSGIAGTSQVTANDPNTQDTHTYAVTTAPVNGTATVNATGLVAYTSNVAFTGTDSLVVTVTDQGTATGTVTIAVDVVAAVVVANSAPGATGLTITDSNGGSVVVGDSLTGSYTYNDVDGDAEGASSFRWLRNGTAIAGATATAYTLVAADSGTTISFEVTPVAATGTSPGAAAVSAGTIVIADTTAPASASISINAAAAATNAIAATLTLSATDAVGVTGYFVSEINTTPAAASFTSVIPITTVSSSNIAFTLSAGDGIKTVYAWFRDAAGNISTVVSDTIVLDTIAPAQTFSALSFSADTGVSNTDFITRTTAQTVTAALSSTLAAGDIVNGSLDGGITWVDITNKVAGTALSWNAVTLTASDTLQLKMTDAAGNTGTGAIASQAYVLDTIAPTVSAHNPAIGATGVAVTAAIDVTFSEHVTGVSNGSFSVSAGGTVIAGSTVNHNGGANGTNESLTLVNTLTVNTVYTVIVTAAITDTAGNALTATGGLPLLWTFTTTTAGAAGSVGGRVSGLAAGESVVLQNNGVDTLTVSSNSTFTFVTVLANATAYNVTISTQPTNRICTTTNGSGVVAGAAVNNVLVVCPYLNDTGITTSSNGTVNGLSTAVAALLSYPDQDASVGRDALAQAGTLVKIGASTNNTTQGFDYTKLDSAGAALANQAAVYATTPWDCVQDHVTGLMWEVKTATAGLRVSTNTYSWYDTNAATNGGFAGTLNGGVCAGGIGCDTGTYVLAVNALTGAARLCGFTDWRLPTLEELKTIVNYNTTNPSIDAGYFPNSSATYYWAASSMRLNAAAAWGVFFNDGRMVFYNKTNALAVRLVRGGQ